MSSPDTPSGPAGYRILARLPQANALGTVNRARNEQDGEMVTLTLLDGRLGADAPFRAYFLAVMRRLAQLRHGNIIRVFDAGDISGIAYVASAAHDGRTLDTMISSGGLPAEQAIDLLEPLVRALESSTRYGLRHRDLDPAHVFVTDEGVPMLLEPAFLDALAIPGLRDERPDLLSVVAPERLRQEPADARTDVHALGGLLLATLTGHGPGPESSRVLRDRSRAGGVPPELDMVLWRALAADPEQRQDSPRELMYQARRALSGEAPPRFVLRPQPSVSGTPSTARDVIRWGGARRPSSTVAGRQSFVTAITTRIAGWSTSTRRAVSSVPATIAGWFPSRTSAPPATTPDTHTQAETAPAPEQDPPADPPVDSSEPPPPSSSPDDHHDDPPPPPSGTPAPTAPSQRPARVRSGTATPPGSAPTNAPSESGDAEPGPGSAATVDVQASPGQADEAADRLGAAAARLRGTRQAPTDRAVEDPDGSDHGNGNGNGNGLAALQHVPLAVLPSAAPTPTAAVVVDVNDHVGNDALAPHAPEQRPRVSLAVGVAAVVALAAGTAVVLATDEEEPATVTAPASLTAANTALSLEHPPSWERVVPAPPLFGFPLQDAIGLEPRGAKGFVPGSAGLVAGRVQSTDARLYPDSLRTLIKPPAGTPIRIGELNGYRYSDLARPGQAERVNLYVLATDGGALTVGCYSGTEVSAAYLRQCEAIAGTLEPQGATAVPTGPDVPFGNATRTTMLTLNRSRSSLRADLAAARTPAGQARLAERLGRTYRRTAVTQSKAPTTAETKATNARLVRQMRLVATSYARLATAARRNQRRTFNSTREQVLRRERQLDGLLRGLREQGYRLS